MQFFVRHATPDDAAGIVAVFNPIIEDGRFTVFDTPFSVAQERAFIENLPPRSIFHVAVGGGGRILGLQSVAPFDSSLNAFSHVATLGTYVDMALQRQGIASALYAATFGAARELGYEKFFTYVRADNEAGLATYLSQGFRIVGTARRQAKIGGAYIDEIVIEKLL